MATIKIVGTAKTDAAGKKLDIVVIPEPRNIRSRAKDFVSSYVNYFVCNGAVIGAEKATALFEAAYDEHARRLARLYAGPAGGTTLPGCSRRARGAGRPRRSRRSSCARRSLSARGSGRARGSGCS